MMKNAGSKGGAGAANAGDEIEAYARTLAPECRELCALLRERIDAAIGNATSKVWHGSPVWFLGENPVVGYSVKAKSVSLLFWNGQAFGEESFKPVGKYGAAEAVLQPGEPLDEKALARWLKKARTDVFDSVGFFAKQRAERAAKAR